MDSNEILYFNTAEATQYLRERFGIRRATTTLCRLRVQGGGPRFVKHADRAVTYRSDDLAEWAGERLSRSRRVSSTAEVARL